MSGIFNPLKQAPAAANTGPAATMKSESAIYNERVGVCPKCNKPMGQAVIENGDTVFYCEADRVSAPMPNAI